MKKFTLIALAAAFAFCQDAGAAGLPGVFKNVRSRVCPRLKMEAKADSPRRFAAKAADAGAIWRAETQKAYGWDGEEWVLTETYAISYDELGQKTVQTVTDEDGYVNRETYTWNDYGQLATRLTQVDPRGNGEFKDYSRLKREYDSRLTSFITFNDQEIFNNGAWSPSNNYKQTITRDDAGNITLMERAVLFQGVYDPTYRLNISYGEDGQAETIVARELTYDYYTGEYAWVDSEIYTDIVWEETDGQIVGVDDIEDFFLGANRMKSANLEMDGDVMAIDVEYTGDGFVLTMTAEPDEEGMVLVNSLRYNELDFSGDAPAHINKGWQVLTTYAIMVEDEVLMQEVVTETYVYTADDLILLEKVEFGDGESSEIESMIVGEVEYDEEIGCPVSWTVSEYDWDADEMMPTFRAEYSDYTNCSTSAVRDVMTPDDSTPVYYDLQGRKVQNPAAGIYIKMDGGKVGKVRF